MKMSTPMKMAGTLVLLGVGSAHGLHTRATAVLGRSATGQPPLSGLLPLRVAESLRDVQTVVFLTGSLPAAERANSEWRRQCTDEWECCAVRSRHTRVGGQQVTAGCTQASVLVRPRPAATEAPPPAGAAAAAAEEEEEGGAVAPRRPRRVFFCSFVTARQLAGELDGAPNPNP